MAYDPLTYWPARYERQGRYYVAKGGSPQSYAQQLEELAPWLKVELTPCPPGGKLLDYGCGPQRWRPTVEAAGYEYHGVDLIEGLGTRPLHAIGTEEFDAVLCMFVLQHIVDQAAYDAAVQALLRALKPSGSLLVVDAEPTVGTLPAHMCPRGRAGLEAYGLQAPRSYHKCDGHLLLRYQI